MTYTSWKEFFNEVKIEFNSVPDSLTKWHDIKKEANKRYWESNAWKVLKDATILSAGGHCEICSCPHNLTAHHITYGDKSRKICVCNICHDIITNDPEIKMYDKNLLGFTLLHIDDYEFVIEEHPYLSLAFTKIHDLIYKKRLIEYDPLILNRLSDREDVLDDFIFKMKYDNENTKQTNINEFINDNV